MEALAVIPARGGSQRIPRKNLREVGGRPLIEWTIQAALESRCSRVVVSTEDVEIATVALRAGAEVVPQPIESAMAGNYSAPVVLSALDFMFNAHGYAPETVVLLHPTSPFRTAQHIDHALCVHENSRGSVISFTGDELNGAIYVSSVYGFRTHGTFFHGPIWPVWLNERDGLDINTWDDLERARMLA